MGNMNESKKLRGQYDYEIIFVDDGSSDKSFQELLSVYENDQEHVRLVKLSRNFGQVAAIHAGFEVTRGAAASVLSADLQDPPDLIHRFLDEWDKRGYEVVLAGRNGRDDRFSAKVMSKIFYSLMKIFAVENMPKGGFLIVAPQILA